MKVKKIMLVFLTVSLVICVGYGSLVYKNQYLPFMKQKIILERFAQVQVLEKGMYELKDWWRNGPPQNKKWHELCPHTLGAAENVDRSYFECNPAALECAIDNAVYPKVTFDEKTYSLTLNKTFTTMFGEKRRYFPISKTTTTLYGLPLHGAIVELALKDDPTVKMRIGLGDICGDVYLPKRIYALGKMQRKKKDWLWDNFSRNYFIDRFQVTNRDVQDWILFHGGPSGLLTDLSDKFSAAPATGLTKIQMEDYCLSYGKSVLPAHIYDAATFHPQEYNKNKKEYIFRSFYPSGIRNSNHFLQQYISGNKKSFSKKDCNKIFGLECFKTTKFKHHSRSSASWSGVFQILGGYPEYLPNRIKPKENLKASSFYLPMNSSLHQLGVRKFWDGSSGDQKSFTTDLFPPIDKNYEVAFRCVREVVN